MTANTHTQTGENQKRAYVIDPLCDIDLSASSGLSLRDLMDGLSPTAALAKDLDRLTQKKDNTLVAAPQSQLTKDRMNRAVQVRRNHTDTQIDTQTHRHTDAHTHR